MLELQDIQQANHKDQPPQPPPEEATNQPTDTNNK